MSPLQKAGVLALAALLLGLQLRAMLGPWEDWPFSSAPMFAYHHAPGDPLYEIVIHEQLLDGSERRTRSLDFGLPEISFGRQLFGEVYGSVDPKHPAGHHPNDTPERFAARMAELSGRLLRIRERKTGTRPRALRYELVRVDAGGGAREHIGRFDAESGRFTGRPR